MINNITSRLINIEINSYGITGHVNILYNDRPTYENMYLIDNFQH